MHIPTTTAKRLQNACKDVLQDTLQVGLLLAKIMIPIVIIVRALNITGWIHYLGDALAPLMELVGLPGAMGLVWATTLLTNLYGGMVFYVGITADYPLTIAQISVLCSMMLVAHNLPMEVAVSRAAGMKVPVALLTRLGGAVLYGILLNWVYQTWSLFDTPSTLIWQPEPSADTWGAWAIGEVKNFFIIIAIIFVLMSLMKLLKAIKITDVLSNYIVGPFLKLFGISKEASLLVVCGMLLGLAYGGAVIIKEARSGALHYRDVFACLFLMNLCHSLVEDTLLMVLLGAELWGILWGRMIFSFILLFVIIKALKHVSNSTFKKYLCGSVARAQT